MKIIIIFLYYPIWNKNVFVINYTTNCVKMIDILIIVLIVYDIASLCVFQEHAIDEKTRLILYKMVNAEVLENVNGIISTGKEAVVFHADGGK